MYTGRRKSPQPQTQAVKCAGLYTHLAGKRLLIETEFRDGYPWFGHRGTCAGD